MTEYTHNPDLLLPEQVIPHRPPSLYLSGILELVPGESAEGFWLPDIEQFDGHFPGMPALMGNKQLEALCQLGGCALMYEKPGQLGVLLTGVSVPKGNFRAPVFPGEVVELQVKITERGRKSFQGIGRVAVNGDATCEDVEISGTILSKPALERYLDGVKKQRANT